MSVLVLAESPKGKLKKSAYEIVHYGYLAAQALGGDCIALVIGAADNPAVLGKYGASKVVHIADYNAGIDSASYANMIAQIVEKVGAHTVVVNHNSTGKSIAGRIAVRLDAGLASQVNTTPEA
ncbi:MAG: electron transfer flavoprotein alpha subunit, partial [Saprospiraceae bacterium]